MKKILDTFIYAVSGFNEKIRPDMTEKLLTGTLSLKTNKQRENWLSLRKCNGHFKVKEDFSFHKCYLSSVFKTGVDCSKLPLYHLKKREIYREIRPFVSFCLTFSFSLVAIFKCFI